MINQLSNSLTEIYQKIQKDLSEDDFVGCEFFLKQDLSNFSTMKLQSFGPLFQVKNIKAACRLIFYLHQYQVPYRILGLGSNQLLNYDSELIVKYTGPYERQFDTTQIENNSLWLSASLPLSIMSQWAIKFNIKNWQVFTGIPATLGGAIAMNAGTTLGEIKDLVRAVKVINHNGEVEVRNLSKNDFSYRKNHFLKDGELIVSALMACEINENGIGEIIRKYSKKRADTQPLWSKNCGCMFKNPTTKIGAGRGIDLLGLKGLSLGDAQVSKKHANFFENQKMATKEQVIHLKNHIQYEFYLQFGLQLEDEAIY